LIKNGVGSSGGHLARNQGKLYRGHLRGASDRSSARFVAGPKPDGEVFEKKREELTPP